MSVRSRGSLWLSVLLVVPAFLHAQVPLPVPAGAISVGTLSFDGHATLGDFTGVTDSVRGASIAAPTLAEVRGWVEAPVITLKTGNGHRDRDLNSSMESDRFPVIRFELAGVSTGQMHGDTLDATLHGSFKIHGVERAVDLPATLFFTPGHVRVHADLPLNLHDYQIEGLSKFLGTLKMHPDITVHVDVTFAFEGSAPPR